MSVVEVAVSVLRRESLMLEDLGIVGRKEYFERYVWATESRGTVHWYANGAEQTVTMDLTSMLVADRPIDRSCILATASPSSQ